MVYNNVGSLVSLIKTVLLNETPNIDKHSARNWTVMEFPIKASGTTRQ